MGDSQIACDFTGCQKAPKSTVRWGVADAQHGTFCEDHIREIWEVCHHQISSGVCFWIQEPISATGT